MSTISVPTALQSPDALRLLAVVAGALWIGLAATIGLVLLLAS